MHNVEFQDLVDTPSPWFLEGAEIQAFLAEMYAVEVSPDLISTVTA
jgi:hypothetical protein